MNSRHANKLEPFQLKREGTKLSGWRRAGVGSTLLLLHGLAGTTLEWDQLMSVLDPDLDVVALDFRGHGQSERNPASIDASDLLADCKFVIDELDIQKVVVLGQSMGGIVATRLAAQSPTRFVALILVDVGMSGADPDKDLSELRSWVETQDVDTEVVMACIQSLDAADRWHDWQSLVVPALVCFAERSFIPETEAIRMREFQPYFEYQVIADSGHDIHLDQPARLAEPINFFCAHIGT